VDHSKLSDTHHQSNAEQRIIDFSSFEKAKGIETLIRTMRLFPESTQIATCGCNMLGLVAWNYNKIASSDAAKASSHKRKMTNFLEVVGAFKSVIDSSFTSFPDCKERCQSALSALKTFGFWIGKPRLYDANLATQVLTALRKFGADDRAFSADACTTLSYFWEHCNNSQREYCGRREGACELIYSALSDNQTKGGGDNDVTWCLSALKHLTSPKFVNDVRMKYPSKNSYRYTQERFIALEADKLVATIALDQHRSEKVRANARNILHSLFPNYTPI
jgi:hypothetical protein